MKAKSSLRFGKYLMDTLKTDNESRELFLRLFYKQPLTTQIALLRKFKGLSQVMLANRSKLKQPEIARVEKTGANPRLKTLQNIIKSLDVKLALVPNSLISYIIYEETISGGEKYLEKIVFGHRRNSI